MRCSPSGHPKDVRERGGRPRTQRWVVLGALLLATFLPLANAASARAGYDPIATGTTTLRLAPAFTRLMKESGIKLEGKGGVTVRSPSVTFPTSGGKLEPVESKGTIEHEGSLVFVAGKKKLPLRSLQLKTTRPSSPYAAKLGGGQLKLTSEARLASERKGFGTAFKTTAMRLSAKVATRLDKKLHLHGTFEEGQQLGTASTSVEPATVGLSASGKVELTIDPAFAAKLASFFVAVNPIFPAEHPGPFTFPIGGGVLAPDGSSGLVKTDGGIEFVQVGGGQFFLREPELEVQGGQVLAGYQLVLVSGGSGPNQSGPVLGLGPGTYTSEPTARMIVAQGSTLSLSAAMATGFDEAFCKPLGRPDSFTAGEVLGTLTYTATAE
jgi:hypothetical protein